MITKVLSMPKYWIGWFNGHSTYWAYPLDMCVVNGGGTGAYYISCDPTGTIATVKTYASSSCGGSPSVNNYTKSDVGIDGLYDFNCNGTVDYLKTTEYVGPCNSSIITITTYAVTNACFGLNITLSNITYRAYQRTQCNATHGIVDVYVSKYPYFDTDIGCATSGYTNQYDVSYIYPTCSYYYTYGFLIIYAEVSDCVYGGYSQRPQYYSNSKLITGNEQIKVNYTFSFEVVPTSIAYDKNYSVNLCNDTWISLLETQFPDCEIWLTTQCTTDQEDFDAVGLSTIDITAKVSCFKNFGDCSSFNLSAAIDNDYREVYGSVTCTKKSIGHMQGINVVVLAFVAIFMYII